MVSMHSTVLRFKNMHTQHTHTFIQEVIEKQTESYNLNKYMYIQWVFLYIKNTSIYSFTTWLRSKWYIIWIYIIYVYPISAL